MSHENLTTENQFSRSEYFAAIEKETGKTSSEALAYALRKDLANGEIIRIPSYLFFVIISSRQLFI